MRSPGVLLALLCVLAGCGSGAHHSAIRVALTAQDHRPLLLLTGRNHQPPPNEQWGYCVQIGTAGGRPVPGIVQLHLQILLGRRPVAGVGLVSFKKGARDHWCGSIGGEYNVFEAVPPGKQLVFQAVVTAMGVTVKRDWPIVVHVVQ
jgi:hypothetical protein